MPKILKERTGQKCPQVRQKISSRFSVRSVCQTCEHLGLGWRDPSQRGCARRSGVAQRDVSRELFNKLKVEVIQRSGQKFEIDIAAFNLLPQDRRTGLGEPYMSNQDLWFEPVDLLSRCSLNEALLWVWADRVPVSNVYREKNVFDSLQDWECERLNIPPVPSGVGRAAQYRTEERLRRKYGNITKDARENHVLKGMEEAEAVRQWLPLVTAA